VFTNDSRCHCQIEDYWSPRSSSEVVVTDRKVVQGHYTQGLAPWQELKSVIKLQFLHGD